MPDAFALCGECEHVWVPRKPPEEIDDPRCADCEARGDVISFHTEAAVASALQRSEREPKLLRDAKKNRDRKKIERRINDVLDRLERSVPDDVKALVLPKVRYHYDELDELRTGFTDRGEGISRAELDGIASRLDEIEDELRNTAPELPELNRLVPSIEELQDRHQTLSARVDELESEEYELAHRVREIMEEEKQLLGLVEDERDNFLEGWRQGQYWGEQNGANEFRVTVPCAGCGDSIVIKPGSDAHREAISVLKANDYGHPLCQTTKEYNTAREDLLG